MTLQNRNMSQYLLGNIKPQDLFEKIYVHLFSDETIEDSQTIGLTEQVNYSANQMRFGIVFDNESSDVIAEKIKNAFFKENYVEEKRFYRKEANTIRLGLKHGNEMYLTFISKNIFSPQLPYNQIINIKRIK